MNIQKFKVILADSMCTLKSAKETHQKKRNKV